MHNIRIGKRVIDEALPCFVIAEAGSNHNGSLARAKELIDAAATAGADAVKFQVFRAKTMYPDKKIEVRYLKNMGISDSLYNIIRKCEVPYGWIDDLAAYAKKCGIEFMATPFDLEAVKLLAPHVNAFKIASYESMFLELIEAVKGTGKPLLISTGGSTEAEIDALVSCALADYKQKSVVLHCIAKYPAPLEETALMVIPRMRERYGIATGYSDHTEDPIVAACAAVALGAVVIEKHFTLDKRLPGPDHAFAVEPNELQAMVQAIRATEKTVRPVSKRAVQRCEKELSFYKRCLYCNNDLAAGHRIRRTDLVVLRNTGERCRFFNPTEMGSVLGKKLKKCKKKNEVLVRGDII